MEPAQSYNALFSLSNNGNLEWPQNTKLICIEGIHKGIEFGISSLFPDKELHIDIPLQAPETEGRHSSSWKLSYLDPEDKNIKYFGPKITFEVKIEMRKKKDYRVSHNKIDNLGIIN